MRTVWPYPLYQEKMSDRATNTDRVASAAKTDGIALAHTKLSQDTWAQTHIHSYSHAHMHKRDTIFWVVWQIVPGAAEPGNHATQIRN